MKGIKISNPQFVGSVDPTIQLGSPCFLNQLQEDFLREKSSFVGQGFSNSSKSTRKNSLVNNK